MRPANCLLFEASPLEHSTAIKNYINIKLSLLLSIEKIKSYMSAGDLLGPDLFIFFMGPPSWGDVEGAPGAVALAALAAPPAALAAAAALAATLAILAAAVAAAAAAPRTVGTHIPMQT